MSYIRHDEKYTSNARACFLFYFICGLFNDAVGDSDHTAYRVEWQDD
jgi:hypothetical protein